MVEIKRYIGFDKENKQIATCMATDANTLLNPEEVKQAIDNVESVTNTEMDTISAALINLSDDAVDAIIVQGTNMASTIEDTAKALKDVGKVIKGTLEEIYDLAVEAHDKLQSDFNTKAYNAVAATSGVVSVRES